MFPRYFSLQRLHRSRLGSANTHSPSHSHAHKPKWQCMQCRACQWHIRLWRYSDIVYVRCACVSALKVEPESIHTHARQAVGRVCICIVVIVGWLFESLLSHACTMINNNIIELNCCRFCCFSLIHNVTHCVKCGVARKVLLDFFSFFFIRFTPEELFKATAYRPCGCWLLLFSILINSCAFFRISDISSPFLRCSEQCMQFYFLWKVYQLCTWFLASQLCYI